MENVATKQTKKVNSKKVASTTETTINNNNNISFKDIFNQNTKLINNLNNINYNITKKSYLVTVLNSNKKLLNDSIEYKAYKANNNNIISILSKVKNKEIKINPTNLFLAIDKIKNLDNASNKQRYNYNKLLEISKLISENSNTKKEKNLNELLEIVSKNKNSREIIKKEKKSIETNIKQIFNQFRTTPDIYNVLALNTDEEIIAKVYGKINLKSYHNDEKKAIFNMITYYRYKLTLELDTIDTKSFNKIIDLFLKCNQETLKKDITIINQDNNDALIIAKKDDINPFYKVVSTSGIKNNKKTILIYIKDALELIKIIEMELIKKAKNQNTNLELVA